MNTKIARRGSLGGAFLLALAFLASSPSARAAEAQEAQAKPLVVTYFFLPG
jgi:hypothetical protein